MASTESEDGRKNGRVSVDERPEPQPERGEPRLSDPDPSDLSRRDYFAIVLRGIKEALDDHATNLAQAIAYNAFLAIPSALLVALGLFGLFAGPSAVTSLMGHLHGIVPASAITLLSSSLTRVTQSHSGGILMIAVGLVLALWSLSGAMQTVMWALNIAYERDETRGFVRMRLTALAMIFCAVVAFALVFGLLVLGPHLSSWIGSALGQPTLVTWAWWIAQWPILIFGLLTAFAAILYFGPNVDLPRYRLVTPGAIFAVVVWLLASGAFAIYSSRFSSYNKTWGSLSAVIIMLTWLWLSSLALLLGAEINAETERSRELRRGEPAEAELQAPTKA